jgi:hypothetical protein
MKTFNRILLVCALSFGCTSAKKTSVNVPPPGPGGEVTITGTVGQTQAHCGGARLPDEVMNEMMKPRPLQYKKMYVKKGSENDFSQQPVLEFTTDSAGRFSISLPPGTYCIIDEFKLKKENCNDILKKYEKEQQYYSAVDPVCLQGWFRMPDFLLEVGQDKLKSVDIIYAGKCSWNAVPCVTYTGPLPP